MSVQSGTKPTEAKLSFSLSLPIIIGIVLISLTMRSPLTSVGPLVG